MGRNKLPGKRKAITHEWAQDHVCIVCMKKNKGAQRITPEYRELIKLHYCTSIDFQNEALPRSICVSCSFILSCIAKGKDCNKKLPDVFDYSKLCRPSTRQMVADEKDGHDCIICDIAKENPVGKSVPKLQTKMKKSKACPVLCAKCGSEYGRGKSHKCMKGSIAENLAKSVPFDVQQKLASATLKEALSSPECTSKESNNTVRIKTGGSKLRVSMNPKEIKAKKLSLENVEDMISKNNLSFNQTSHILSGFWKALGRNAVESNIMEKVVKKSHSEDQYFCLKTLPFQDKNENQIMKTIPVVRDIEQYLGHVYESRSLDPFEAKVKIGIDFGGQSLKVGMYVVKPGSSKDDPCNEACKENFNSGNRVLLLANGSPSLASISKDQLFSHLQFLYFFIGHLYIYRLMLNNNIIFHESVTVFIKIFALKFLFDIESKEPLFSSWCY